MTKITYFQRYHQKENWITNSTLLLLTRLHRFDPFKFQKFFESVFKETELAVGVRFNQQVKGAGSIADGVLEQQGFKIVIETKLYDNFNRTQLKQHVELFNGYTGTAVLLALSTNKVNKAKVSEIAKDVKKINPSVNFASLSYKDLADSIFSVLSETDFEMREIVLDYIALCQERKLISLKNQTMLVVTTGLSLAENLKYHLYYDPADRTHSLPFEYIGLYNEKAIRAVGRVIHEVVCEYQRGKLIDIDGLENLSAVEKNRIKEMIENTPYYDLTTNTRFFVVEHFYPTMSPKRKGSVRGKQYIFLNDQYPDFKDDMSAEEVAGLINNKFWE